MRSLFLGSTILFSLLAAGRAGAATATFFFAPVGGSYLAFLPPDDPAVGKEITAARIYLDVESFPGSDAGNFFTDIAFPIDPFPGNENGLALLGDDLGWSGPGVFNYFEETDRFNGVFIAVRYGAETPGEDFEGAILDGSRIEFDYVPEPATATLVALAAMALARPRPH